MLFWSQQEVQYLKNEFKQLDVNTFHQLTVYRHGSFISGNLNIAKKKKNCCELALTTTSVQRQKTTSKCSYKPYAYLFCEFVPYRQERQNHQDYCSPDKGFPPCSNLGHVVQTRFFRCPLFKTQYCLETAFIADSYSRSYRVMKFWVPGRLVHRVPKEVPEDRRADKKMREQ